MNLQVTGVGNLPRFGDTVRLQPSHEDDLVIGMFNGMPETASAVHLQTTDDVLRLLLDDALEHKSVRVAQASVEGNLILPHENGYAYVAAAGCRVFLERTRPSRPLVDPDYFYVVGVRERELPISRARKIGNGISNLFSPRFSRG